MEELKGPALEGMSTAKAMESLDRELLKPLPGREDRPEEAVIEAEMNQFKKAAAEAASTQGG